MSGSRFQKSAPRGHKKHRPQVKSRIRQGRTVRHTDGTSTIARDTTTIAEPVIPIVPWLAGPALYAFGVLLHEVWLTSLWERLFFVLVFAVAGAIIGRFAAEYGKARTSFQRRHAALTPPLFSVIVSVPLVIGWGRISSLLVLTYWVTLSGGWVARVARSVWGDGSDSAGMDSTAMFGEALRLPGLQVGGGHPAPVASSAGNRALGGFTRGLKAITGSRTSAAALPPGTARVSAEEVVAGASADPGFGGLPFDATDPDHDGFDDLAGKVYTRRLTARGLQGYQDIAAQVPGLRNATRAHLVTAHPVEGNPQAADVRFVMADLLKDPTVIPGPSQPTGTSAAVPLRVGIRQDGAYQLVSLVHTMPNPHGGIQYTGTLRCTVSGCSGAGKSGLTWNVLYELADRGDVTVWMSDVAKAGQTAAPALGMIDWLALDLDETEALLDSARRIIAKRAMVLGQKGLSAWQPGCGLSLLVIIFEEAANVASARRSIAEKLTRLAEQARSVGIVLFISMQRPSAKNMPTDARAQRSARVCFGLDDDTTEKMALSPNTIAGGANPRQINTTCPGLHWYEGSDVLPNEWAIPARTFYIEFEELRQRTNTGAPYRTPLDAPSATAAGETYTQRYGGHRPPPGLESLVEVSDDLVTIQDTPRFSPTSVPSSTSAQAPINIPKQRREDVVDAEVIDTPDDSDPDAEYEAYVSENLARASRSPQEVLDAILSDLAEGSVTTSWLVRRWAAETDRSRRELYRALDESPRIERSGERGKWVLTAGR